MATTERALEIIRKCERELQGVLQQAAESGQYDRLLQIGRWARNMAAMATEAEEFLARIADDSAPDPGRTAINAPGSSSSLSRIADSSSPGVSTAGGKRRSGSEGNAKKKTSSRKSDGYPRFARQGDQLVKIGWSKKQKKEYQHKAPHSAVQALLDHLRKHTQDGQRFTIEELLPVPDPDNDGEMPTYQVYLGIAWLRCMGVLNKHGREGYSVEHHAIGKEVLAKAWAELPSSNL